MVQRTVVVLLAVVGAAALIVICWAIHHFYEGKAEEVHNFEAEEVLRDYQRSVRARNRRCLWEVSEYERRNDRYGQQYRDRAWSPESIGESTSGVSVEDNDTA